MSSSLFTIAPTPNGLKGNGSTKRWRRKCTAVPSIEGDPSAASKLAKNCILLMIATGSMLSPMAATIYYPALFYIQRDFQASDLMVNASISVFTFITAIFPLFWSSLSDNLGRRPVYLISFFITIVGNLGCALATNMAMFLGFRIVSAMGSSSVMSLGVASLGAIFDASERGRAMGWYTAAPLLGPAFGPVIGGALAQNYSWRSNFWFITALTIFVWLAMLLFLPETHFPTRSMDDKQTTKRHWLNPFSALAMFKYPNIALCISFHGLLYMVFFTVNTLFTRTYTNQYGLSTGMVGLCYLPMSFGTVAGAMYGGRSADKRYNEQTAKHPNRIEPEMRLGGWVFYAGILLQCLTFIGYGWCVQENVHFAVGLVILFFLGAFLLVPYNYLSTYYVDCFRYKGGAVTACSNLARYGLSGIFTLYAPALQTDLGDGILFSICGGGLLLASVNVIIAKYMGPRWRRKQAERSR
ncbi:MFS general substrate transporter [Hesseltinella vesiculosa]|uniref:MFS general substrate transporter n=1 Tax=Hesseltinella vesiculosa TaxID=101127 RepID=A0A1X2GQX0_9FUNG|nr:MFS general substrate transporter [Hesseltinella vesiculosa]